MDTLQAGLVGFVQGLSEFLPISSSAHIVFTSALYKLATGTSLPDVASSEEIFFDIAVHLATLIAVFIFFRKEIVDIIKAFFVGLKTKDFKNPEFKISIYIIITTFITGVIGLLIKDLADILVANPKIVSLLLLVTGCVLLASEKFKKNNSLDLSLKSVIFIGIAQGLAVFPGLSRSGLTIATAVFQGIERAKAARFSFLMSAPVIILASMVYPFLEFDMNQVVDFNFKAITVGFIVAFVSGYLCIKYFMKFVEKYSLAGFSYYCFMAGIAMFILFSLSGRL